MDKNWWDAYQGYDSTTFEGKVWLAACHCSNCTVEKALAIGALAFDNNWPIWHASWVYHGSKGECGCAFHDNLIAKARPLDLAD